MQQSSKYRLDNKTYNCLHFTPNINNEKHVIAYISRKNSSNMAQGIADRAGCLEILHEENSFDLTYKLG